MDNILKREVALLRESASYLFYGEDESRCEDVAIQFIQDVYIGQLQKRNIHFDEKLERQRIKNYANADFFIYESPSIDEVREIKRRSLKSSLEGGIKIVLIKNVKNMRKESANALLKLLEEPLTGNFFILMSGDRNILPTIKSRCIIFNVLRLTPQELGVDKYIYDFFNGNSRDIIDFKKYDLKMNYAVEISHIPSYIKAYENSLGEEKLVNKIKMYVALREYVQANMPVHEKINFAENIYSSSKERATLDLIIAYYLLLNRHSNKLKDKLTLKGKMRANINQKLALINILS